MDFAKAFFKVPHKKLIRKLRECGIISSINQWIESFLHQRQQRVVCDGWGSVLMGSSNKRHTSSICDWTYIIFSIYK